MNEHIDSQKPSAYHSSNLQTIGHYAKVGDFIQSEAWNVGAKVVEILPEGIKLSGDSFSKGVREEDGTVLFTYEEQIPKWRTWFFVPTMDANQKGYK